jgi:hypothetical protein
MIMLAAVRHRDGEPPEPGLHLSPRGRLVNLGSSGGASASSGSVTLCSGGLSIPGYANNQPPPRPRRVRQCTIRFCRVPTAETTFSERFDGYIRHRQAFKPGTTP